MLALSTWAVSILHLFLGTFNLKVSNLLLLVVLIVMTLIHMTAAMLALPLLCIFYCGITIAASPEQVKLLHCDNAVCKLVGELFSVVSFDPYFVA